jgi:hypothetical protein
MEKTQETLAQEIAAMRHHLGEVSAAIDAYETVATQNLGQKSITSSGAVSEKHTALFLESSKLLTTVRGPVDMMFSNIENVSWWCRNLSLFLSLHL